MMCCTPGLTLCHACPPQCAAHCFARQYRDVMLTSCGQFDALSCIGGRECRAVAIASKSTPARHQKHPLHCTSSITTSVQYPLHLTEGLTDWNPPGPWAVHAHALSRNLAVYSRRALHRPRRTKHCIQHFSDVIQSYRRWRRRLRDDNNKAMSRRTRWGSQASITGSKRGIRLGRARGWRGAISPLLCAPCSFLAVIHLLTAFSRGEYQTYRTITPHSRSVLKHPLRAPPGTRPLPVPVLYSSRWPSRAPQAPAHTQGLRCWVLRKR